MTSQPTLLLDFPDEVLLLIAECLESARRDLSAFAYACARLTEVADPCLYRRIQIRSGDQAERLSNALHRRPQRCSFIRQLVLVPAVEHAHNIMNRLRPVLDLMHLVEDLTVVVSFYTGPAFASELLFGYRERFGDIFEAASIVSCVAKPRAFQALRSCKLSFHERGGRPWRLGVYSMVFLHDTLESLTLVAARIIVQDVNCLRHHIKLTRLSRLRFDGCSLSPRALKIILSVPQALKSLELMEHDFSSQLYDSMNGHADFKIALSPPRNSLRDLHLGLSLQGMGFIAPYDLSSFTNLRKLTLECTDLDDVIHSSPMVQDGTIKISRVTLFGTQQIVWITLPERPFSLELQMRFGERLTNTDVRRAIERLGRSLRRPCEGMAPQPSLAFETRLVVSRQTDPIWFVPPHLYDEVVPEKVVCYDSFGSTPNWDYKTDAGLQGDGNVRSLAAEKSLPSPNVTVNSQGTTVHLA